MGFNLMERIASIDRRQWLILLLIFLIGFGIRGHNLKYDLFFGFDSYYHARMVTYVLEDGTLPDADPLAYWQIGYSDVPVMGSFFWYFTAAIYKIATFGATYDKELWIEFVKILPALFGALTAVALFFFGKELYSRKAGYAMALTAAVVPGFVYRTMSGFFEDDSLGFLWMIIGFVFFARAMNNPSFERKNLVNGVLAGLFFGIMSLTWSFFMVAALVIVFYFIFAFFKNYKEFSRRELQSFVGLFALISGIFVAISFIQGGNWINGTISLVANSMPFLGDLSHLFVYVFLVGAIGLILVLLFLKKDETQAAEQSNLPLYVMLVLYFFFVLLLIVLSDPGQMFSNEFRPPGSIFSNTIGEESFGFPTWGYKYSVLIVFPLIALLLIPYRLFREKRAHLSIMIFFWVWIALFMAFYKLQYTYVFGLPIAAATGLVVAEFFHYFKKTKLLETRVVAIALALLLLTGVAAGSFFASQRAPTIETIPEWKDALYWAKDNTPENSRFFNWWNWGHWVTFIAEKETFLDNRNAHMQGNSDFGHFITTTDLNKALRIMKKYEPDYLIFSNDLFSMSGSMLVYAYQTMNPASVPELQGKIPGFFGVAMNCHKNGTQHVCGSNVMSEQQFNSVPTKWSANPTQVQQGKIPLWSYKNPDNSALILVGYSTNFSTLGRLWFHEDEAMKYFDEVFANRKIKIFKVNKYALETFS